jgi:hypothetical protein
VVELAIALPLVCLVTLAVVQVGVLVRDRLAVHEAARAAARLAATGSFVGAGPGWRGVHVVVAADGSSVVATASYVDPTDVPLIGALLPDVALTDSVVMPAEPP